MSKESINEIVNIDLEVGLFYEGWTLREQANKILEEAAEVFSAVEDYERNHCECYEVFNECADVIQAAMNMIYCFGFEKNCIEEAMGYCLERNIERGRC